MPTPNPEVDPRLVQAEPLLVTRPVRPSKTQLFEMLASVIDRNWYSNFGPLHQALEAALRTHLHADRICLMNNGTQALTTALRALKIRGEVITTPFTFPATPHAIEWASATPIFADVDSRHMTLDPSAIEAAVTPRTEAILGVHVYGIPCDVEAIERIAKKHHLAVVYDAAHAFNTEYLGRPLHSFGDATMLSFHATKLFHCGEGGALVARDASLSAAIAQLRNFGICSETAVDLPGSNGKMNEFQAAVGLGVLPLVGAEHAARARLAEQYRAALATLPHISHSTQRSGATDSMQYFPIRLPSQTMRDCVYDALKSHNIFARKYFYPLCSSSTHYTRRYRGMPFPTAEACSSTVLCLPFHSGVSPPAVTAIIEILARCAHKLDAA